MVGALRGTAEQVVDTVLACLSEQVNNFGVAQLSKIPGVKMYAGQISGAIVDKLAAKIKEVTMNAVNGAIDNLRRRRILSWVGDAWNAVKNKAQYAAGALKEYSKRAAKVASAVASSVHKNAKYLNKLSGGKLSEGLQSMVCSAISTADQSSLTAALASVEWPFGVSDCMMTSVTNGCVYAIEQGFK